MRALVVALLASLALVGGYAAAGGGRFAPREVADPCQPRGWRAVEGATAIAEQVALSAIDGAACKLHVSRESLVLALATRADLEAFGREHQLDEAAITEALRDGLRRAVDDAGRAGAVDLVTGFLLRQAIGRLPLDGLLSALQGTTLTW